MGIFATSHDQQVHLETKGKMWYHQRKKFYLPEPELGQVDHDVVQSFLNKLGSRLFFIDPNYPINFFH